MKKINLLFIKNINLVVIYEIKRINPNFFFTLLYVGTLSPWITRNYCNFIKSLNIT